MATTINTPFGKVPRWGLVLAVTAGGGALVFAYVKEKNAKNKSATAAPTGAYGYGSYGYGAYGYGAYGYGAYTYEPYGYGFGPYGLGSYPGGSYYGYGYYGAGVPMQVPMQASTNAQWSQAAISALTAQGYTGQQVLSAIGPYLAGKQISTEQSSIIQQAIAVEGYPPVEGATGFPPGINTGGTGGGGGGQPPHGNPGIHGKSVSGLRVAHVYPATKGNNGAVQIEWNQLAGATSYQVFMEVKGSFTTNRTVANEGNLSPGNHSVMVTPEPGGKGASVSFKVPKAKGWKA